MLHKTLLRQLRKLGCNPEAPPSPATWRALLEGLTRHYEESDRARYLLERSLGLSADEMRALNTQIEAERDQYEHFFRWSPVGMARVDCGGRFAAANPQFGRVLGRTTEELVGEPLESFVVPSQRLAIATVFAELAAGVRRDASLEETFVNRDGSTPRAKLSACAVYDEAKKPIHFIVVIEDITAWTHLQIQLRHAQKLESVGRLAAGIAHEINTPIQYVANNILFLEAAFSDLLRLCEVYRQAIETAKTAPLGPADLARVAAAEETADLEYALENVPRALRATEDGAKRVAKIVQSMKSFAHPDRGERTTADVNAALRSTLTVASNELKYVADVETEFGELPPLPCFLSDLNQVFLNLLVNAAHAIEDVVGKSGEKGLIRIKTACEGDHILVTIADSGSGIPEAVRDRIFEPFFTTKSVGKGTGQGLALARSVIVDKHGGTIDFVTEVGKGTTFFLRLLLLAEARSNVDAA